MQASVKRKLGKVAVTKFGEFVIDDIKITAVPFNSIHTAESFTVFDPYYGNTNLMMNPLNVDIIDDIDTLRFDDDLIPDKLGEITVDWIDAGWLTGYGAPF